MTTHPSPARTPSPRAPSEDPHRSLHSQAGARPGEHPGRSGNPLVKVAGLAWLEFEKPDLDRAKRFGTDFGFTVVDRTPQALLLRDPSGFPVVHGVPEQPALPERAPQLALELAPRVRVNAVAPGVVRTRMAEALWKDDEDRVAGVTPLRRIGEPADIGGAVAFLASDRASWITGTTLVIDGGQLLAAGVADSEAERLA